MTYKQIQDRIMARTNLTSTDARTRIKDHINESYRRLQTSIGLGRVRRSTQLFNTTAASATYDLKNPTVTSNVVKVFQIAYPAGNRVLGELTEAQIRESDPDISQTGAPQFFVVQKYQATSVIVRLYPTPDATYQMAVDGLVQGTDMSGDTDVPAFPEDFHDILVERGIADEFRKMEKLDHAKVPLALSVDRTRELRYFLAKSAYLHLQQATIPWWWGPFVSSRRWGW